MPTRPTPINPAEAIFEPFWDPAISPLSSWRQESDIACGGAAKPFWSGAMLTWQRGNGKRVLRMWREVDWEVGGFDHVHVCISLAATTTLAIRAVVDGQPQELLAAAAGRDAFHEYEGGFVGRRMTRIELELHDSADAPGQARLMWLGVFHDAQRAAIRSAPNPFEGSIDKYLVPESQSARAAPALGLFFDDAQLERLRSKAALAGYAPLVDQFRQRARAGIACEPWRGIGLYPNAGGPRCGRGGEGGHIDPLAMRLGGLIGLIDNDRHLLRMAARHAIAMAHCDHWFPDFMEAFPGSPFEQRAFFDYRYGTSVVFAWDWAGGQLSQAGRDLLAHAVVTKALPRIHETLMRHRYVRTCNQGAYMAYGAIVCVAALSKVWPHARDFLAPARKALDDTAELYLMPDGGAAEGPGYVTASLGHMLVAYQLIANIEGKRLDEIVPTRVARSAEYLLAMLSTAPPAGSAINVSDGGRPGATIYPDGLALLAELVRCHSTITRDAVLSVMSAITAEPLRQESFATPGSAFVFIHGPDNLPAPQVRPPTFKHLEHTGHICSCRETPRGPVRVQIIGTPANASHSHEDYGSFVLEAFGEEIVIDRGQMQYSDPRCGVIKAARYHNLLIPLDEAMQPSSQVTPSATAILPSGRGDATTLHAGVDATAAWGPAVQRWVRAFDSESPDSIVVTDEMMFDQCGRAVGFYLHSRFPWHPDATQRRWVTRGVRAELVVTPDWRVDSSSQGEDFIDGGKLPVHTLILRAAAATTHRLVTRLMVTPVNAK